MQRGGHPRGVLGGGGRGTRRRGDQDAGGRAAGQGDPHGIAGHDGRERDKPGKQRGRQYGGEHDGGERKPVGHQAADGGGPTSHASVTSTVLAPGSDPPGTPRWPQAPFPFVTGPGPIQVAACLQLPKTAYGSAGRSPPYFQVRTGCRSTSAAVQ